MRNIWLVAKHDIIAMLRQRSFWLLTMLMPLLLMVMNAYLILDRNDAGGASQDAEREEAASSATGGSFVIGLVDETGLIAEIPPSLPQDLFVRFPDEATARAALEAGDIGQYVNIPADYIASGEVTVYTENFQLLSEGEGMGMAFGSNSEWMLPYIISYNLTGDEQLPIALRNPTPGMLANYHALNPAPEQDANEQALAEVVAAVLPYVYYFLLIMASNYLMRAVVAEKENRTAEVLLLSIDPREMMVGKILAGSAVMLVQVIVWVGGGFLILNVGADMLDVANFQFPPGFVVWASLFLILGYLLFASVMAATGALASNAREAGPVTFLLIIPLMPTLMFGPVFLEDPHGTLAMVLSLFPFSAPTAMVTRLAVAEVPLWQILFSLAALGVTAYLFIVLSARFFRAGNLLSSEAFSLRRLAEGLRR
jgi:ABC-2 type transport system permease protein